MSKTQHDKTNERMDMRLEAVGVSKEVSSPEGPIAILSDVTLRVGTGEAIAILGPSGSGKTTLLALLAGLDNPTRGEIRLLDHPLGPLDEDGRSALRAGQVGFVFQDFNLLARLTAEENIRIGAELGGVDDAVGAAHAALVAVGLETRAHHYPETLSGGEQQRVAIARAFAPGPAILFADEPTGNLDTATGERIIDLLFQLRVEYGTSLILATHDERLAQRCERRLTLANGTLSER